VSTRRSLRMFVTSRSDW